MAVGPPGMFMMAQHGAHGVIAIKFYLIIFSVTFRLMPNERNFVVVEDDGSHSVRVVRCRNSAVFGFIEKSYLIHTATQNEFSLLTLLFLPGRISATHESQNYARLASPLPQVYI